MDTKTRIFPASLAAILLGAVLASASAQDVLYRWTDDEGTTHFTETPPPDREYKVLDMTAGTLSVVEAPEYAAPEPAPEADPEAPGRPAPARADPRRMTPVERARHCDELGERLRWLIAGRADMLTGVYPEEEVRNTESRGRLIEEVAAEIDEHC